MLIVDSIRKIKSAVSTTDSLNLDRIFPNRKHIPWNKTPPHPLLQKAVALGKHGMQYETTFHDGLMEIYRDHLISSRNLFPGAGMVEIGLAAYSMQRVNKDRGNSSAIEI